MADPAAPARPYFIPESVDYDALPDPVRRALAHVVGPAYHELVERAMTALERSAGVTLVFLLAMEVLDQFAVSRVTDFTAQAGANASAERDKLIDAHLRLVTRKQAAARFMLRLSLLRQSPYDGTLRRLPI
jgi:hypothetical protein